MQDCCACRQEGVGLVVYLLQSLQISPTIAGIVLQCIVETWCAWPIDTKAYANCNTIAAANNFIVNESFWNISQLAHAAQLA